MKRKPCENGKFFVGKKSAFVGWGAKDREKEGERREEEDKKKIN